MVASPNAGTVLADREHLSDLLDRITDLAQFVPDNGVTDTLGLVFAVVKQLAVGAVGGLDGLMSMNPAEDYLARAERPTGPGAPCSGRSPPTTSRRSGAPLARVARDGATDLVFAAADNDLVVPDRRLLDVDGAAGFPIDERLVLDASTSVDHNSFFRQPEVSERLLDVAADAPNRFEDMSLVLASNLTVARVGRDMSQISRRSTSGNRANCQPE